MNSIRFYREKAGLTQADFAAACGFSGQPVISNYETGYREPGLSEIRAMQAALRQRRVKCTIEQLMSAREEAA